MARVDVRPDGRARDRRAVPLLAICLAVGLTVVAVPVRATAAPAATRVAATEPAAEPGGDTPTAEPTDAGPVPTEAPPTTAPPPQTTPPAAPTEPAATTAAPPETAPTTAAPTTAAPPPVRPPAPAPDPPASPAGVRVTTDDITLTPAYWNAPSTVSTLRVTITNTGTTPARIRLAYTLPAGLTDAGTRGCAAAGGDGEHRCGEWASAPGARFSALLRVRVAGDAWRRMPLGGSVRVTANAPGANAPVGDDEGFAVLFPPGPPVPGIRVDAGEVSFDIGGVASGLDVSLDNTGRVDADGRIEVILPAGVTVPAPPAGCVPVTPDRTRCELGTVAAGRGARLRLPVSATPEAQRRAPLAGAVLGQLDPPSGRTRQVQMSFRITAAAALATPVAAPPAPTGSQGVLAADAPAGGADGGDGSVRRTAVLLIVISTLLVVFALALAIASLRRRLAAPGGGPTTAPTE
ncbi:hypothetical protein [Micromonospora sp. KLBMP9576]|uniref:hypothetical protein n=1 Tax=Micromonospora sp. KLBMP9576 TaxID=3424769 RepID=UPI003D8C6EED